jgi:hypothetical protein
MPAHLIDLPKELLENILVLLGRKNAQSIQTCRHTCRMLKPTIAQSTFVQYLEGYCPSCTTHNSSSVTAGL